MHEANKPSTILVQNKITLKNYTMHKTSNFTCKIDNISLQSCDRTKSRKNMNNKIHYQYSTLLYSNHSSLMNSEYCILRASQFFRNFDTPSNDIYLLKNSKLMFWILC